MRNFIAIILTDIYAALANGAIFALTAASGIAVFKLLMGLI